MAPKFGEFVIEKCMHPTVTRENMPFLPLEGMVSEHTNIDIYFLRFFILKLYSSQENKTYVYFNFQTIVGSLHMKLDIVLEECM